MIHELKTWPEYFKKVTDGSKLFEVRKADREFNIGDSLLLKEYSIERGYTGNWVMKTITYILPGGQFGIEKDYCVLGLSSY